MSQTWYTPKTPAVESVGAGTFRPVTLERDAILQRVSRDLYASPASGLRELIANELTAARKAMKLGANPTIEVTVKPDLVRVQGFDSLGITRETFEEIYLCLGRSGNFDPGSPGQFGLGRLAYITLADTMLVETRPRGEDPYAFRMVGTEGCHMVEPPDIPHGTRVTLTPRGFAGCRMAGMVRDTAAVSEIPIRLIDTDGVHDLPRIDPMEGCYATRKTRGVTLGIFGGGKTYLCGMPVRFTYRGRHGFLASGATLEIRDEHAYRPTPDRERLVKSAEVELSGLIDGLFAEWLREFPRDLREALGTPGVSLAARILDIPGITRRVWEHGSGRLDDRPRRRMGGMGRLMDVQGDPILNCTTFRREHAEAVWTGKLVAPGKF